MTGNRPVAAAALQICAVLLLAIGATASLSDFTAVFSFAVGPKTEKHPFFNQGTGQGYLVSSASGGVFEQLSEIEKIGEFVQGGKLVLLRNTSYLFDLSNVSATFSLFVSTSPLGDGFEPFTEGVDFMPSENLDSASNLAVKFSETAPRVLYYAAESYEYMGGVIELVDQPSATAPTTSSPLASVPPVPVVALGQGSGSLPRIQVQQDSGLVRKIGPCEQGSGVSVAFRFAEFSLSTITSSARVLNQTVAILSRALFDSDVAEDALCSMTFYEGSIVVELTLADSVASSAAIAAIESGSLRLTALGRTAVAQRVELELVPFTSTTTTTTTTTTIATTEATTTTASPTTTGLSSTTARPAVSWAFNALPTTRGLYSSVLVDGELGSGLMRPTPSSQSKARDIDSAIRRLADRPSASCDTVVASGLCASSPLFAALCPVACEQSGYDSCGDNDALVATVWQSLGQFLRSPNHLNCSYTRRALACSDATFAALCPTTCGVCLKGVSSPDSTLGLTSLDFDYALDVVRQEIRESLYSCAMARRSQAYACGSERVSCPLL